MALKLITKEFTEPKTPNKIPNPELNEESRDFERVPAQRKRMNRGSKRKFPNEKDADRNHHRESVSTPRTTQEPLSSIIIIGDSVVKNVQSWRTSRSTRSKILVKSFPGASLADFCHYLQPTLDRKPGEVIFHIGTKIFETAPPEQQLKPLARTHGLPPPS